MGDQVAWGGGTGLVIWASSTAASVRPWAKTLGEVEEGTVSIPLDEITGIEKHAPDGYAKRLAISIRQKEKVV